MIELEYFTGIVGADIRLGAVVMFSVFGTIIECDLANAKMQPIGMATRPLKCGESVRIGRAEPSMRFDIVTQGVM